MRTLSPAAPTFTVDPELITITNARKFSGLSRSTLYELESEQEIRFVRVLKEGKSRGRVLVDLKSLRQFLTRCADGKVRTNGNN